MTADHYKFYPRKIQNIRNYSIYCKTKYRTSSITNMHAYLQLVHINSFQINAQNWNGASKHGYPIPQSDELANPLKIYTQYFLKFSQNISLSFDYVGDICTRLAM